MSKNKNQVITYCSPELKAKISKEAKSKDRSESYISNKIFERYFNEPKTTFIGENGTSLTI